MSRDSYLLPVGPRIRFLSVSFFPFLGTVLLLILWAYTASFYVQYYA